MAIIKCPECGRQISDKAPTCPSCGVEIAGKSPNALIAVRFISAVRRCAQTAMR